MNERTKSMALVLKGSQISNVDPGIYVVQLSGIEPTTHASYGAGIKWAFTILSPETFAGAVVTGRSSMNTSPKSKLYSWALNLGHTFIPGEEFDLESLVGRQVKAKVEHNTKTTMVDNKPVETTYSNVVGLKAMDAQPAAVVTPAAAAPVAAPAVAAPAVAADADVGIDDFDDF